MLSTLILEYSCYFLSKVLMDISKIRVNFNGCAVDRFAYFLKPRLGPPRRLKSRKNTLKGFYQPDWFPFLSIF